MSQRLFTLLLFNIYTAQYRKRSPCRISPLPFHIKLFSELASAAVEMFVSKESFRYRCLAPCLKKACLPSCNVFACAGKPTEAFCSVVLCSLFVHTCVEEKKKMNGVLVSVMQNGWWHEAVFMFDSRISDKTQEDATNWMKYASESVSIWYIN